jgi:hypothetical protein
MVDLYGDGRWIYIKNSTSPHGLFKFDLNSILWKPIWDGFTDVSHYYSSGTGIEYKKVLPWISLFQSFHYNTLVNYMLDMYLHHDFIWINQIQQASLYLNL